MLQRKSYRQVREYMQPGDVIAFGGQSIFSRWAKFTTGSSLTHVAIVMENHQDTHPKDNVSLKIMESAWFRRKRGVMKNCLHKKVRTYKGNMWWLPLSAASRAIFEQNQDAFFEFMQKQDGKPYDIQQLFGAAIDVTDQHPILSRLTYNQENYNRWFCSELVAAALKSAGVVDGVNASETTPIDVCRFDIFENRYVQLKGKDKMINGFNTQSADNWGQIA